MKCLAEARPLILLYRTVQDLCNADIFTNSITTTHAKEIKHPGEAKVFLGLYCKSVQDICNADILLTLLQFHMQKK